MKQLLLSLIFAGACSAQQPCVGGEHPKNAPDCIPAEFYAGTPFGKIVPDSPAPLRCEKYEHVVEGGQMPCSYPEGGGHPVWCGNDGPAYCAPDLHTVAEKEWQELMARLKKLENPPCPSILDRKNQSCPL